MKIKHTDDYVTRRKKEYPLIEEQLDALWKGGKDAADMKARIVEIKLKYPKLNKLV